MPTYQYACTTSECGNEFELVQSFTDPAASECPACGGPVRKVYSAVGVVFKGSGFYRTDSRSDKRSDKRPASKESTSSSSSTADSSSSSSSSSSSASNAGPSSAGSTSSSTTKTAAPA